MAKKLIFVILESILTWSDFVEVGFAAVIVIIILLINVNKIKLTILYMINIKLFVGGVVDGGGSAWIFL